MKFGLGLILLFVTMWPGSAAPVVTHQPRYARHRRADFTGQAQLGTSPVVVNAASDEPGICPGSLATVIGPNLSDVTGTVSANSNPLPTELASVSVLVNDIPAPIVSVAYANGQDQITFQVPLGTPTGAQAAQVTVLDYGNAVLTLAADSYTEDPAIFLSNGADAWAVREADGSAIQTSSPANPGDVVIVYATGLGPVSLPLTDGVSAPADPSASSLDSVQVLLNGEPCQVLFAGQAPGAMVGLHEVAFVVPSDAAAGDLNLQLTMSSGSSNIATISVQ